MTDIERWKQLSESDELPSWHSRTIVMSQMIPKTASVLDIGCGNRHLKQLLNKKQKYTGIDCVKSHKDTIVIDFNKDDVDNIDIGHHDIAFCSGVLEYILDPIKFLRFCKKHSNTILLSYILAGSRFKKFEGTNGWQNAYIIEELTAIFNECGLNVNSSEMHKNHTIFNLS